MNAEGEKYLCEVLIWEEESVDEFDEEEFRAWIESSCCVLGSLEKKRKFHFDTQLQITNSLLSSFSYVHLKFLFLLFFDWVDLIRYLNVVHSVCVSKSNEWEKRTQFIGSFTIWSIDTNLSDSQTVKISIFTFFHFELRLENSFLHFNQLLEIFLFYPAFFVSFFFNLKWIYFVIWISRPFWQLFVNFYKFKPPYICLFVFDVFLDNWFLIGFTIRSWRCLERAQEYEKNGNVPKAVKYFVKAQEILESGTATRSFVCLFESSRHCWTDWLRRLILKMFRNRRSVRHKEITCECVRETDQWIEN